MKQIELKCRAVRLVSPKSGKEYDCIEVQLPDTSIKKIFFDRTWNYKQVHSVISTLENAPEVK